MYNFHERTFAVLLSFPEVYKCQTTDIPSLAFGVDSSSCVFTAGLLEETVPPELEFAEEVPGRPRRVVVTTGLKRFLISHREGNGLKAI